MSGIARIYMFELYIIVLIAAVLMSLPLASARLAYAYDPEQGCNYDALRGLSTSSRTVVYIGFGLLFVMLVLMCINKSEMIADYGAYLRTYEMGASRFNRRGVEPTYGIITMISPTFRTLLLIYALMSVSLHLFSITKNASNLWLSLVVYLTMDYVLHDMIQIRAAVATGLLLLSIRFISERKWWIYFPLVVVATFFHYSAVVFLPLYFLPTKNMLRPFWIGVLIVGMIMGFTHTYIGSFFKGIPVEFINKFFQDYMGNKDFTPSDIGLKRIYMCLLLIVMTVRIDAIKEHYPLAVPSLCVSILSQMSFLTFGDIPVMQGRMGELFGLADIYTLSMFPMAWRKQYYLMFIPVLIAAAFNLEMVHYLLTSV